MTDTNFRALCAELLKALEYEAGAASDDWAMLRVKAGAALAQPEARAAILAVADWLDQQELHIAATRLRMDAG